MHPYQAGMAARQLRETRHREAEAWRLAHPRPTKSPPKSTPGKTHPADPRGGLVWAALAIIYLVWGSTYVAIKVAVETMPPLLMTGLRFLVAGGAMYLWLALRRRKPVKVSRRELQASALVGTALLLGGTGMVGVAEQHVTSGLAALLVASIPLWVIVLRLLAREGVARGTSLGVLLGFAGVAGLMLPGGDPSGAPSWALLLLVGASVSWAAGTFASKKVTLPGDPLVSTALQMVAGGTALVVASGARGEFGALTPSGFSLGSILAFAYLVVFGSWLAFTAYVWLLQNAPVSKVATYAYVNPVVALVLGWAFLGENVTIPVLVSAALILVAVAWIVGNEAASGPSGRSPAARERRGGRLRASEPRLWSVQDRSRRARGEPEGRGHRLAG